MKKEKFTKGHNNTLFSCDAFATELHAAVTRDLAGLHTMYGVQPPQVLAMESLQANLLKKYVCSSVDTSGLDTVAFGKFFQTCDRLRGLSPDFDLSAFTSCQIRKMTKEQSILYRARSIVSQVLREFSLDKWFSYCRHSGGTSLGVPFVDTSLESKSTFPITMTLRVKKLYDSYLSYDFDLKAAIDEFNGYRPLEEWYEVVQGSRATTVPKNAETNRMIAIEPTGNMFFQQGLMLFMYERLRDFGLDVETLPTRHQWLAKVGSLSGLLSTIDFASASDSVTYDLVKFMLPSMWFWACDVVRCPFMDVDNQLVDLPMFSTMGNATTFPLETLIFWALAEASRLHDAGGNTVFLERGAPTVCSVFGDDCILPTKNVPTFVSICSYVGFQVNLEKSFFAPEPGFRESCGGDYQRGYDVVPIKLKAPADYRRTTVIPWLYALLNRLTMKYIQYFGPLTYVYDKEVFRVIFDSLDSLGEKIKLVPEYYPEESGFKTGDYLRFKAVYSLECAPVIVDSHGSVSFSFWRFVYRGKRERDLLTRSDHLHYSTSLKKMMQAPEVVDPNPRSRSLSNLLRRAQALSSAVSITLKKGRLHMTYASSIEDDEYRYRVKRANGSYVVANAVSSHWALAEDSRNGTFDKSKKPTKLLAA